MRILLLDRGLAFDGSTLREAPLGGAESAFVHLAEALAALGHEVEARTAQARPHRLNGVSWASLDAQTRPVCDLAIASRIPALLDYVTARAKVLWLHNPAGYLRKPRHLWPLLRHRPHLVVLGRSHAMTVPRIVPRRGLHEIPLGLDPTFIDTTGRAPPPPVAIFTSNPERGLDWLVDLWTREVHPALPQAQLHVYAGAATYGGTRAERIDAALRAARDAGASGVAVFAPVPKAQLHAKLKAARVMAYRGDPGETFCLAAAEARASGVPIITAGLGALSERVIEGVTGFIAPDASLFAARLRAVLDDDALWHRLHEGSRLHPIASNWEQTAKRFAALGAFG